MFVLKFEINGIFEPDFVCFRCLRTEDWESAIIWYTKAREFPVLEVDDTLNNIFTALYLFEGLILYLVDQIDRRNVRICTGIDTEINILSGTLKKISKKVPVIQPR